MQGYERNIFSSIEGRSVRNLFSIAGAVFVVAGLSMSSSSNAAPLNWKPISANWDFASLKDPMTYRTLGFAQTSGSDNPTLFFGCDGQGDNSVHALIIFTEVVGKSAAINRELDYRVDSGTPQAVRGTPVNNNIVFIFGDDLAKFAKDIRNGRKLFVRRLDVDGVIVDAELNIAGVGDAISRVARACGSPVP